MGPAKAFDRDEVGATGPFAAAFLATVTKMLQFGAELIPCKAYNISAEVL
jgi:hypothetical protein